MYGRNSTHLLIVLWNVFNVENADSQSLAGAVVSGKYNIIVLGNIIFKEEDNKSRILETLNLSTSADSIKTQ